jgi:hypothetical protein
MGLCVGGGEGGICPLVYAAEWRCSIPLPLVTPNSRLPIAFLLKVKLFRVTNYIKKFIGIYNLKSV